MFPVANVKGLTLGKVLEYCKYHADATEKGDDKNEEEIKAWDNDYIKVDTGELFEITLVSLKSSALANKCLQIYQCI